MKNEYIAFLLRYLLYRRNKLPAVINFAAKRLAFNNPYIFNGHKALPPPATIMIRITHRSNLIPTYCGMWAQIGASNGIWDNQLTTMEWKEFIKAIAAFRPYIFFEGGEPLLRDDVVDLARTVSSYNMLCGLRSNGTKLEEHAEGLIREGLDYILCNLEATEPVNGEITGDPASFKRTITGIKTLINVRGNKKLPLIQMTTSIHQKNQHLLFELAQLAEELGVDVFAISFPIFTTPELEARTRERFQKELGVEPKYWKGFIADMTGIDCDLIENQLDRIRSTKWRFAYRQFPPATKDFKVSTHFRNPEVIHGHRSCRLPWSLAVILPNGDVSTCWDHPDYIVGNILKQNFIDIWNGERYRRFRQAIRRGIFPACPRCTALYQ